MDYDREIELKYREEFRSVYGQAFQNWFEKLAVTLHGEDCFLAVRVTRGDGGLDGLVLKEGRVYQLYAPPTLTTDASTATKVKKDFLKAMQTLGASLRVWTFLHNSQDGRLGHTTVQALVQLKAEYPTVDIEGIGIDGLWERMRGLPRETLAALFGMSNKSSHAKSQVETLLRQATELAAHDERHKAFETLEKALVIAENDKLAELQAEVLISLSLISSARGGMGDKGHYLQRAQALQSLITDLSLLVMLHRARASYHEEQGQVKEAESAYVDAIALASSLPNSNGIEDQLCVARSEYVHLLCSAGRTHEAREHLTLAESYAKQNPKTHRGEILQAALSAGMHWAAEMEDEDAAIERIRVLETSANTSYLALRVADQLISAANSLSHLKCHRAALAASEAALHLADKTPAHKREAFLPGALYTLAMVNFQAGRLNDALQRANSLVNINTTPETAPIRFAAAQLISVVSRQIGDLVTAVEKGQLAISIAPNIDSSFMAKINAAEALADTGQTERALSQAQEAYHLIHGRENIPMIAEVEILGHIANYSSQLGEHEALQDAMKKLSDFHTDDQELIALKERISKRVEANAEIRRRIVDISLFGQSTGVVKEALDRVNEFRDFIGRPHEEMIPKAALSVSSLHEANALTIAPLMKWWEDTFNDLNAAALDYDYWGRGCFAQILRNLQAFPHSLNVVFEVRTIEDIRRSLRLWSLYADFILLLWKGPTKSGQVLHLVDGEWFGPWGAGYLLALGTKLKTGTGRARFPALGYASWLPEDVTQLLANEARPFLASGRLLLVPASGVGCVSPGHGVIEQLLTETANCIPAIHDEEKSHLPIGLLPYVMDAPLDVLFDFVNDTQDDLQHMRKLMFSRTSSIKTEGLQPFPKAFELEIADTLKRLRSQNSALAKKRHLSKAEQDTQLGVAPFYTNGRSVAAPDDAIYSPLLTLESMGYSWKVGESHQSSAAYRYEPAEGEAIGAWLAPPECGVRLLAAKEKH